MLHCDAPNDGAWLPGAHIVGAVEPVAHALPGGHGVQSEAATRFNALE